MAKLSIAYLESLTIKEIYALAKEHKITYYSKLTKRELIFALLKSNAEKEGFFFMEGVLEIIPNEGFGFLRPINYSSSSEDIYISASQIRRFELRTGDKFLEKFVLRKKMNVTLAYSMLRLSMEKILKWLKKECISQD